MESWINTNSRYYALVVGGIKRYRDPTVCLSVCLSVCPSLGYRIRPRTDADPPRVELPSAGAPYRLALSPPRGDNLFSLLYALSYNKI